MARPPKVSIDYAGWSVNLFDNDPKMDKLLDAQGWCGFGVYFFLCQRAYGSDGYFYKWCYDDCATTARKMGGGIGAGTVKEAVDYCLRIGLFDEGLFVRWGVLTSRGIQKRYIDAIRKRDVKEVIAEYWLLHESEECEGLLKLPINTDLSEGNTDSRTGNRNFRTGNPSFRAKSKVKESKYYYSNPDLNREFCLYLDMRNHTGPTLSAEQINALKEELDSLAENDSDKLGIVRKAFGGGYKSFFPTSKKRKKSTPKPKKEETIHNFTQREVKDCDYENLERQLLKKQLGGDITYG